MKIFKYRTQVADSIQLQLPKGAKILSVDTQQQRCFIWALVNPDAPTETRHFRIVTTGEEFNPSGLVYVGSWHGMVFHLFEQASTPESEAAHE